ncbi:class V chitinase-like [Malania oleifera]|uniref:class V chitinase-like n=1 Tax=Malania oleifera TaxID=397392 RepID=UPI0025AE229C|nr:class V chitinase-like [Malania oleifera]
METKTITLLLLLSLSIKLHPSKAQTWIKAGYWYSRSNFPFSDFNSALFGHLLCSFAYLNSSNYHLSIRSSDEQQFSSFTNDVKLKNPSVTTLFSIWAGTVDSSVFSSMISQPLYRKSFIESSIRTARLYSFHGLVSRAKLVQGIMLAYDRLSRVFGMGFHHVNTSVGLFSNISFIVSQIRQYDSSVTLMFPSARVRMA